MSTSAAPSARRLAANRANASKSTGPRTEAGKRVSSQNARKTPPCPFTFQLPAKFEAEWFHEALRRTAGCSDTRARLLLINRCMLQAHEIRWTALERTLFDVALEETGGCVEDASLWLAQQIAAAKGLTTYHRWIAHRINLVERSLSALAAQSAGVEAEAPKTMAAGAGAGSAFSELSTSDLGPDSTLPISYSDSGWSFGGLTGLFTYRVGAPQPPQPPKPPKPPTIGPIRGRYRLYLRCPAAPERPNEATAPSSAFPERQRTNQSEEPQQTDLHHQSASLLQDSGRSRQRVGLSEQPALLSEQAGLLQEQSQLLQSSAHPQQSQPLLQHLCPQTTRADEAQVSLNEESLAVRSTSSRTTPENGDPSISLQQPEQRVEAAEKFQQPSPLPRHSPRHCRGPVAATTTSGPNPTQSQPNLCPQHMQANKAQRPVDEKADTIGVASPATTPPEPQRQHPSQQPSPLPQHSPRHCRGPVAATRTSETNPTQPQPMPSSANGTPNPPEPHPSSKRTQSITSSNGSPNPPREARLFRPPKPP